METEQVDLRSFVARCVSGEKQNDSVDSGVCPSPAEGFQNYDEAFPPLSALSDDGELNLVVSSWQSAKRPADPSVYSFAPSPINFLDSSSPDRNTIVDQSSPIQAGATPIKRPKLQPLNDLTNRPLRSCPDLPSQKSFLPTVGNGGGVTFCCPMVSNAGAGVKASRASPQFVVPKCFKVGSWPSRSGKGCKHANDVPFWSCTEWFCTVHKGLEFGLLSAKVGVDAARNLAPQHQNTNSNSNCPPNSSFIQKDAAATVGSCCSSSTMDAGDGMFDAPRFILHIINENENVENEYDSRIDSFADVDDDKFNENYKATSNDAYDWTMTSNAAMAEFTFMPFQNNNLQPNVSSSFPPQEVGFCLPKFDLPSAEQQCKIQSSCNASPFSKLSELQLQQQQQQMTSNQSSYANLSTVHDEKSLAVATQSQPATVAVPISPNTHFVPIRSESMEDAYYPKPGFDDSFGSFVDDEDYFVYRDREMTKSIYCKDADNFWSHGKQQQKQKNDSNDKVTSAKKSSTQRRSLPLKFKASLPVKIVQTDGADSTNDEMTNSLDADFEIWACKPVSISGSLLSSIQWPENFDGQLIVGPFSSLTWGDRQTSEIDVEPKVLPTIVVAGQNRVHNSVERSDPKDDLELWQRQDEQEEDLLLQFVSNISLMSPLESNGVDVGCAGSTAKNF